MSKKNIIKGYHMFKRKKILITGITGSLGQELTKQLLKYNPGKIVGISRRDHDQEFMETKFNSTILRFHIGDVRNTERLKQSMEGMDYVIHTSASKHIHRGETDALEYKSNIVDSAESVIKACMATKVKKCVALSTDKASDAISVYGASKLLSDRLFMAANNYSETKFAAIRYGNVIASNGSIIKKINESTSNEINITDRSMTRFWITIERAAELTIHLLKHMNGGELLIPKLPSCNVLKLFKILNPSFNNINDIGLRLGEKIHESMFTLELSRKGLEYNNYYIIYANLPNKYEKTFAGECGLEFKSFKYCSKTNPWKISKSEIKSLINGEFKWNQL